MEVSPNFPEYNPSGAISNNYWNILLRRIPQSSMLTPVSWEGIPINYPMYLKFDKVMNEVSNSVILSPPLEPSPRIVQG
jgi:hypothetical protein